MFVLNQNKICRPISFLQNLQNIFSTKIVTKKIIFCMNDKISSNQNLINCCVRLDPQHCWREFWGF